METVLDCVLPYIHDGRDRNSISLVSRKFYELDCITRKHATVYLHYAPSPFLLNQRFPFIESLTLKEFPAHDDEFGNDTLLWIQEIAVSFKFLKALHIRHLCISDYDVELLAKTRGNDLRSLKIYKCDGISENGLRYISMYCDKLTTLCVNLCLYADEEGGEWLRELASRNTGIETFSLKLHEDSFYYKYYSSYYKDIVPLLKSSCKSIVSLRIMEYSIYGIGDDLRCAVNLAHLSVAFLKLNVESVSFKFPPTIRSLGIHKLSKTSLPFVLPHLNQLRELEINRLYVKDPLLCSLLQRCPNLEALCVKEFRRETGLQLIGQFCKKLRRLTFPSGTQTGLIAVAQGCANLELLHVILRDISNEALECIGSNLKSLCDLDIQVGRDGYIIRANLPLDNGIRAMLIGCTKLERLGIHLYSTTYLTDVGMGFIGKYGVNLRSLSLTGVGESDAGLVELSKGCPKLRKLKMMDCFFSKQAVTGLVFNIHSLRYTWGQIKEARYHCPQKFSATRPNSKASTITSKEPYIILVERLCELAVQLVAGGSAMKYVKVTLASATEPNDLDTQLLRTVVSKSIIIVEERVILDRSSEKPLESIQVQILEVESRFESAISESGVINIEGKLKDGVPHLTKVGAFEVVVSLPEYSYVILSSQVDQPGIIGSIRSILLTEDHVSVCLTSVGRTSIGQEAVMAFVVDWKPHERALKRIGEIAAVKEVVLITNF